MSELTAYTHRLYEAPGRTELFALPELTPSSVVLQTIHNHVQDLLRGADALTVYPEPSDVAKKALFFGNLFFHEEGIAAMGLSGVLLGAKDNPEDTDAQLVERVLFATDPSASYGVRTEGSQSAHIADIAHRYGWVDLINVYSDRDPHEVDEPLEHSARCIMGRGDKYGGEQIFDLSDVKQGLLRAAKRFKLKQRSISVEGGRLFSTRPGWDKPYSEPAAVISVALPEDLSAQQETRWRMNVLSVLGSVAYNELGWQHRLVPEFRSHTVVLTSTEQQQ